MHFLFHQYGISIDEILIKFTQLSKIIFDPISKRKIWQIYFISKALTEPKNE